MPESKITPFVEWLGAHKKGEVDSELTYHLREVIEAVRETGKDGTVTLTLKVKRKGERQVTVIEDVKFKLPMHDRSESIYFVDADTNLTRDDPAQTVIPFGRGHIASTGSDQA